MSHKFRQTNALKSGASEVSVNIILQSWELLTYKNDTQHCKEP